MSNMNLIACRNNIEEAFKSLIQSGRPDIRDEENNDLIPQLYVDLFENNYILRQALDENHVIINYPGASTQALCSVPTSPLTALAFCSC